MKVDGARGLGFCFTALLLIGCASSLAQGQTESAAPSIEILKLKWEKEIRLPRNFDPSPIPTNGAFNPPASSNDSIGIDHKNRTSCTELYPYRYISLIQFPATPTPLPLT